MRVFSRDEAADFLKCSPKKVSGLATLGILPAAKVGRAFVFMEDALVEYLRELTRTQTSERQVHVVNEVDVKPAIPRKRGRPRNPIPKL